MSQTQGQRTELPELRSESSCPCPSEPGFRVEVAAAHSEEVLLSGPACHPQSYRPSKKKLKSPDWGILCHSTRTPPILTPHTDLPTEAAAVHNRAPSHL